MTSIASHLFRFCQPGDADHVAGPQPDVLERPVLFAIDQVTRRRDRQVVHLQTRRPHARPRSISIRMRIRERLQQHSLHDAEDRSSRADADGQRQQRDRREHRRSQKPSKKMSHKAAVNPYIRWPAPLEFAEIAAAIGIIKRMRTLPLLGGVALLLLAATHADVRNCQCDVTRPETLAVRECSLCKAAEAQPLEPAFFLLRDANPNKPNRWLALPRFHGHESAGPRQHDGRPAHRLLDLRHRQGSRALGRRLGPRRSTASSAAPNATRTSTSANCAKASRTTRSPSSRARRIFRCRATAMGFWVHPGGRQTARPHRRPRARTLARKIGIMLLEITKLPTAENSAIQLASFR